MVLIAVFYPSQPSEQEQLQEQWLNNIFFTLAAVTRKSVKVQQSM